MPTGIPNSGVRRRKEPPTPEIVDAELIDIAEQIKLGVRVDARVAVDAVAATEARAAGNEPALGGSYHHKPAHTHLFRPLGDGHGDRRQVPIGNLTPLIRAGWTLHCPYCGDRNCSQELNVCPGMEKKQFVRCPTCGKRIRDEIEGEGEWEGERDEFEVVITPNLTAQQRLTNRLSIHMRTFHPQAALQYGFGSLVQPLMAAAPEVPAGFSGPEALGLRADPPLEGGDLA